MDLVARHDQTISEQLINAPRNVFYVSPDVQNSLLEMIGEIIHGKTSPEIDKTGYCTLRVLHVIIACDNQGIACDNPKCTIEWFHITCLQMERLPKGKAKWYCPDCRVLPQFQVRKRKTGQ